MHRLYVRWPGQKRYQPVNWRKGLQVSNLIYATLFTDDEMGRIETELHTTSDHNVGMEWQWRANPIRTIK